MSRLGITENQILTHSQQVTEKLFCAAVINEGTDYAWRVLGRYNEMLKILEEKEPEGGEMNGTIAPI